SLPIRLFPLRVRCKRSARNVFAGYVSLACLMCIWLPWNSGSALAGQAASGINERFQQATAAMRAGRLEEAKAGFSAVVKLVPTFAEAYLNLGLVLEEQGKNEEAIPNLWKALSLKPRLRGANLFLGIAEYRLNQFDDAIAALKKETTYYSTDANAWMWLGVAQLADNRPHPGVRVCRIVRRFLLQGGNRIIELIEPVFRNSQKEIRSAKPWLKGEGFPQIWNRFFVLALFLKYQSQIEVRLRKRRHQFHNGRKTCFGFLEAACSHCRGGLLKPLIDPGSCLSRESRARVPWQPDAHEARKADIPGENVSCRPLASHAQREEPDRKRLHFSNCTPHSNMETQRAQKETLPHFV